MNIIKKIAKKNENRLPMPDKVKRCYRYYCSLVAAVALRAPKRLCKKE